MASPSLKDRPSLKLAVCAMHNLRPRYDLLAMTNKVYVSPATFTELGIRSDKKHPLVKVNDHPYMLEAHPQVQDGQIALNGLHRSYAQLNLAAPVSVKYFRPPLNFALASIEFTVDLAGKSEPREVDTDRLAADVLLKYEEQPFEPGRVVLMDFEGIYLELTVKQASPVYHENSNIPPQYQHMGLLLQPTEILFSCTEGASQLNLEGSRVVGAGAKLEKYYRNGFVPYGDVFEVLMGTMERLVEQVRTSSETPPMRVLLQGPANSGKTAVAAKVAADSGFPFVRVISADEMIGYSDMSKCQAIHKVFLDSYKSPLSLIFIDDIEHVIEYVPVGPIFSKAVLHTLLMLLRKVPPVDDHRLLVIGTTSCPHLLEDLGLTQAFSLTQSVPLLDEPSQISKVLRVAAHMNEGDAQSIARAMTKSIGIKQLLMAAKMARQRGDTDAVDKSVFIECLRTVGS